jgi:hypothetical protein
MPKEAFRLGGAGKILLLRAIAGAILAAAPCGRERPRPPPQVRLATVFPQLFPKSRV